jgi:hypothetical protein
LATCNAAKTPLQNQIDACNKKIDDSKNNVYLWFAAGLILGIVAVMFYTGKWGAPKARNYEENFNRGQAA